MTEQEIVDAWKVNTSAFGLLSKEMQEWAKENSGAGWHLYRQPGEWSAVMNYFSFNQIFSAYRLRSDYELEPEVIEAEIRNIQGEFCFFESSRNVWINASDALTKTLFNKQEVLCLGFRHSGMSEIQSDFTVHLYEGRRISYYEKGGSISRGTHAVYRRLK